MKEMSREVGMEIDALTLAVVRQKLLAVSEEIVETMVRTCFSPLLNQSRDLSAVVLDGEAQVVAQAFAAPAATFPCRSDVRARGPKTVRNRDRLHGYSSSASRCSCSCARVERFPIRLSFVLCCRECSVLRSAIYDADADEEMEMRDARCARLSLSLHKVPP